MAKKGISQAAYARHRGISPTRVGVMIRDGKIPASCYTEKNGRRFVNAEKADKALAGNLDQIKNRPKPLKATQAQKQAHTWALHGNDNRDYVWDSLRYLVKLQELDPDAVKVDLPGPGEDGIIFKFTNYDGDTPFKDFIFVEFIMPDEDPSEYGDSELSEILHDAVTDRLNRRS